MALSRFSSITSPMHRMSRRRVVASVAIGTPYGSVSFSGSNSLSVPNNAALNPGTGDFTIEFWTYLNSTTNNASFYRGNNNGVDIFMNGSGRLALGVAQVSTLITDSVTMTTGAWVHVAAVRISGTTRLYKNGVLVGSAGDATNYVTDSVNYIGTQGSLRINGYISNLRVVIGTGVYTGAFIPPTSPLQVISGTQLLLSTTNDANFLKDYSSNNFTVTNTGTVVTASLNPFYSITTSATITAGVSIGTANGSPFSTSVNSYTMASQPASAPYNSISVPGNNGFAFGTGDFTVEWFQYVITSQTNQRAFWYGTSPSIGVSQEGFASAKTIYSWVSTSPTNLGTANLAVSTWQHHAVVRISSKIYYYINGNILNAGGTTSTSNYTDTTSTFYFGSKANTGVQTEQFIGSMTNMRIVKGLGVYTGNFTKPTGPLTAVATSNPYGGSNTAAITSGLTSLLLNP